MDSTRAESAIATHELFADRPIQSAKEDLLGRAGFAKTLAQAIEAWCGDESLTIALSGEWGSGKTSLKNMVLEYLRKGQRSPEIVEFNPWKWDTQEKISTAFYREISVALGKVDPSTEGRKRVRRWKRYARLLTFGSNVVADFSAAAPSLISAAALFGILAYFFPSTPAQKILGPIAIAAAALAAFLKFGGTVIAKLASVVSENLDDDEKRSLDERKSELTDDLKRMQRSILVVIDDLDRITKEEARLVIQHIKVNADFPRIIYLLLYRHEIVASHLDEPPVTGKEFLEKIVQLPFDIPVIPATKVHQVLTTGLDRITNPLSAPFDQHRWGNLFVGALSPYFENLRSVNRFLSTFSVYAGLFRGHGAYEVNVVDLIAIEVLRVFEPLVYHQVAAAKTVLTTGGRHERGQVPVELQRIFDSASEPHKDIVKEILKQMFPPIEASLGGSTYSGEFRERWRDELRVCSEHVFDRYFTFGIPEGDLSESEFKALIDATEDRTRFIEKFQTVCASGLLDVMLDRLDDHAPRLPLQNARPLTCALMELGDNLPTGKPGFFAITPDLHLLRIIVRLLTQETEPSSRGEILLESLGVSERILIPAMLIANDEEARKREGNTTRTKCFDDDQLISAKAIWIERIKNLAEHDSERLLTNNMLLYVLYRWKDWEGNEEGPETLIPRIVNNRKRAIQFITAVAQTSTVYSAGDYVSKQSVFVRLSDIEQFMAADELASHLDAATLDIKSLTGSQLQALEAFRDALQRRSEGKSDSSFFDRC